MNKIIKKTISQLEHLNLRMDLYHLFEEKPEEKDLFYSSKMLTNNIIKVLSLDYSNNDVGQLVDSYTIIEPILFELCELTMEEAGFVINRLMNYNYTLCKNDFHLIVTYNPFEEAGYERMDIQELLTKLVNGEEMDPIEKEKVNKILEKEHEQNKEYKEYYIKLEEFINSKDTNKDYSYFTKLLKGLKWSDKLIEAYITYLKSKEKEEVIPTIKKQKKVEITLPPRGKLKKDLYTLYKPDILDKYFDYQNINEVLRLINQLGLSDERIKIILNDLFRCAIKNEAYYNYLVEKALFEGKEKDIVNDIIELRDMYGSVDFKNKQEIDRWLLNLYKRIEYLMIESFNYENKLIEDINKQDKEKNITYKK
ncbi:MAG: hypothetical protein IJ565_02445 [Bacilli bacterium]|nr:hypothetical protein [Bacilli bacterium]